MYGYFKFAIEEAGYNALQVSLSNLCKADPLVQRFVDRRRRRADKNTARLYAYGSASSNARVIYNSDSAINGALLSLVPTIGNSKRNRNTGRQQRDMARIQHNPTPAVETKAEST